MNCLNTLQSSTMTKLVKEGTDTLKLLGTMMGNAGSSVVNFSDFFNTNNMKKQIANKYNVFDTTALEEYCISNGFIASQKISEDELNNFIKEKFTSLVSSKAISPGDQRTFKLLLDRHEGRKTFADCLGEVKDFIYIASDSTFRSLADFISFTLTMAVFKKDKDAKELLDVLKGSRYICLKVIPYNVLGKGRND
eukprot:TRINITY_DN22473_c0_g1_i1.p1 TRINITY_DN22473_c0_g1~~TRINITY_DN22473_c0_g1_i1.p1  ORF type:complete len:194 (+),score=14.73 TRINITY_DN22473_c0_g1_i1:172-753(+)